MAENFSAFDYKTQEEVLTVLKYLTSVLSTSGMQLVETLSPAHLLKQLHEPTQPEANVCSFIVVSYNSNHSYSGVTAFQSQSYSAVSGR